MKHQFTWAVLALCLLALSCSKPDTPTPEPEPEVPVVRNNQMYALINGEEWRSCGPVTIPKTMVQNFRGAYIDISGVNFCQGASEIYLKVQGFYGEGVYTLGGRTTNLGRYSANQNYDTNGDYAGTLTITQADSIVRSDGREVLYEISGTFAFTALGEDSTSVLEITEGQFVTLDVTNH